MLAAQARLALFAVRTAPACSRRCWLLQHSINCMNPCPLSARFPRCTKASHRSSRSLPDSDPSRSSNLMARQFVPLSLSIATHLVANPTIFCLELRMAHHQHHSCIDACNACANACDHCSTACLKEPDVKEMAECIRLDMDCAAICRLAASYMARGSDFAKQLCSLCADICEACGKECARHQHPHCQECAKACQQCADECRRMASAQ